MDYQKLYDCAIINGAKLSLIDGLISKGISNKDRYLTVVNALGNDLQWWICFVIHSMECSLNFKCHLHNGDPLTAKTIHVPINRPKRGTPPFMWEDSAIDAMRYTGWNTIKDLSLPNILKQLEWYNGSGYAKRGINSPYLWSATSNYGVFPNIGKFTSDGKFDPTIISQQIGAAAIIKRMDDQGMI
jgi:lysozyme family protein